MTWVEVCGLREEEHVTAAITAGADGVGSVLADRSPRWVSLETAAESSFEHEEWSKRR